MTPRASDLYFKLLDAKMEKISSSTNELLKALRGLNSRAAKAGIKELAEGATLAEMAAHRRAIEAAEGLTKGSGKSGLSWFFGEPLMDWNKIRDFANFRRGAAKPAAEAAEKAVKEVAPAATKSGFSVGSGLLGFGLGGGLLGYGGYQLARQQAEEEATKNKLMAFGGGVATGLAAPSILNGVNKLVKNQGFLKLNPYTDEYESPMSQSMGYDPASYPGNTLSLYGGQY
jgi:hypothetical protein